MFRSVSLVLLAMLTSVSPAAAQYNAFKEGVQSFQQDRDAWRRQDASKIEVLQNMSDSMGTAAMENITGAEQVFCYQVANRPADYTGYTIDGMALTGFCGVINQELREMITRQFFATEGNIDFNTSEQCIIKPKLMLRFVRGVDYTDVLVSAPCYSVAIFYGGKVKAYNFKPAAEILDVMVESFNEQGREFTSPALLNQLLPIGVAQTAVQQQLIKERAQPIRQWDNTAANPNTVTQKPAEASQATGSGWNKLKPKIQP